MERAEERIQRGEKVTWADVMGEDVWYEGVTQTLNSPEHVVLMLGMS